MIDIQHYPLIRQGSLFIYVLLLNLQVAIAQTKVQTSSQDSVQVEKLNQQFDQTIKEKRYNQAATYGTQALKAAEKNLYLRGKIKTLLLFGKLYTQTNKVAEALTHYLQAEGVCQTFNASLLLTEVYDQMAGFYQQQGLYKKAVQYFRQSYALKQKKGYRQGVTDNLQQIAEGYSILENYSLAYIFYEKLLAAYPKNKQKQIQTLEQMALIASVTKNYSKAIKHQRSLLKYYQRNKQMVKLSEVYNNLGFLYQRKQDIQTALDYFSLSAQVIDQQNASLSPTNQVTLLVNTGVAYTNMEAFSKAKKYFRQALKATEEQEEKQATIYNYLSTNYYLRGDNFQALTEVQKAINIALPRKDWNTLLTSYDLLARLYQAEGNKKKALELHREYRKLKSRLRKEATQKQRDLAYNLRLMEQQETRIKGVLAEKRQLKEMKDIQEKQRKDLALKNNLVALQQKELALLKKAKELNQANAQRILLDKVRQEQALLISKGKLREANLAKAKTLATLEVERKEAEKRLQEKENQKHVALLNKEKKLQQQQIKQQKEKARYAIGIVILVVSILGLVLALLFVSNKNRQKLKKQKVQIEEQNSEIISQNEELQQQQEEIVAQRDNIEEKNKLLGRQNHHIQQSIKAALTIQDAILPEDDKIAELVPDNFILYRPKDVVSGDFYWGEKLGNKHILAAVDCTGHGVPGAFMSMIGSNLLNRIVLEQKVSEPKDILSQLNQEIEKVLRQKEKGYKNGMDLAIIVWEKEGEKTKLTFGGAKRHMYCFKNGDNTIQKVNASRYSIGYANPVFEQKSFVFEQGDTLYLSSDGYVDQNNVKRKKFGSRRFEAMLSENQHLPMPEQKVVISRSLDEFMGGVEQRDDILVIGVKF